jgi:hypothetical protein
LTNSAGKHIISSTVKIKAGVTVRTVATVKGEDMKRLLTEERGIATALIVILIVVGVAVVGIIGTAAVLLSNSVNITVNNQTNGPLDIAEGSAALNLNFLPGINVPSTIAQGDTAVVQVPKRFVDYVTVLAGSVELHAFSRSFTFGTSNIDPQRSTWDGKPLASLVGQQVKLSGNHTLVLQSK